MNWPSPFAEVLIVEYHVVYPSPLRSTFTAQEIRTKMLLRAPWVLIRREEDYADGFVMLERLR